jgi:hypothetical protein
MMTTNHTPEPWIAQLNQVGADYVHIGTEGQFVFHRQGKCHSAALAAAKARGVIAKPQERKGCVKYGFVWLENNTRMHRDCDNPTTAKRWKK